MSSANRCAGDVRSRRWFLLGLPAVAPCLAWATRGTTAPSQPFPFLDEATENRVTRLTDLAYSSTLPRPYARIVDRHGNFLIYGSDMTGRWEAYRLDIKKGQSRQLTEAGMLGPVSLLPGDNAFCYVDGAALYTASFSRLTARELYRGPGDSRLGAMSVSIDGLYAAVIETQGATERVRLVGMRTGDVVTLAEADAPLADPIPRPRRASVLYRRGGGEIWLANYDGKQNYRLRLAPGQASYATWSPGGRSVLYLNVPAEEDKLHSIREFVPDTNEDRLVADTTQFVSFDVNADASMFVGASGSLASPYVLLLARKVNRELTLCEHGSDNVAPIFSPDSQRVYFSSAMHGKSAIYEMDVAKLVEQTGDAN